MEKLKKHGPILMFIVVLGLCAGLIYLNYDKPEEMLSETKFDQSVKTVSAKLSSKDVEPDYAFAEAKKDELKKMPEIVDKNVSRLTRTTDVPVGVYVAYPQPMRPRSDKVEEAAQPVQKFGSNPGLAKDKIKTHPDQGAIYVEFRLPQFDPKETLTELVRVQVFRGTEANKIDTTKPFGVIELGPEEPPPPPPAGTAVPAPAPDTGRARGTPTPGTGRRPPPRVEVPKDLRAFRDTDVQQLTTYYYQLRLIVRFTGTEGKFVPALDKEGKIIPGNPGYTLHTPDRDPVLGKNYTPVPSSSGAPIPLYAMPLTDPVSATTPFNFTIRLEGVVGDPPKPGQPRDPASPLIRTYAARFEIGVWRPDMDKWTADHIQVKEGDMLGETEDADGKKVMRKFRYTVKGTTEKRDYEYAKDLGYKFIEIVQKPDPDSRIAGQLTDVAILENQRTKKSEEFVKQSSPKARAEILTLIDTWMANEAEAKKSTADRIKQGIERSKSDGERVRGQ